VPARHVVVVTSALGRSGGGAAATVHYKSRDLTRRWGQYGAKSIVAALTRLLRSLTYIVERVGRRCDVVELVIEKICVRVGRRRNGRMPHGFLQQTEIGACPA
jgi:hypothetical protein